MLLDLRTIIDVPGGEKSFDYEPDMTDVPFGSIENFEAPPGAVGKVVNRAGVLTLTAEVDAMCLCVCARCLKEFTLPLNVPITAYLVEKSDDDEQETDNYIITNERIDLDEVLVSEFTLAVEERILCSDECKGLCQKCGFDLNAGLCDCEKDIDPRLQKLAELLE